MLDPHVPASRFGLLGLLVAHRSGLLGGIAVAWALTGSGGPLVGQFADPWMVGTNSPSTNSPSVQALPPRDAQPFINPFARNPQSAPATASPVEALLAQAASHEREGHGWQAINCYRQALQLDPKHRKALLSYARMKHRSGDFEGAIVLYSQYLNYYPNDPVALNDLGLCFARQGNVGQAISCLDMASRQQPANPRYRNNLAIVLVDAGRSEEALEILKSTHGPAIASYNLASLLAKTGRTLEAEQYARRAVQLDPALGPGLQLLAQLTTSPKAQSTSPVMVAGGTGTSGDRLLQESLGLPGTGGAPAVATLPNPTISLRSGILHEEGPGVSRAVWHDRVGNIPPDTSDYPIPGLE